MTEVADLSEGKLDLGRVARDTLAVTGKRPGLVLGLAAVLSGLPSFFGSLLTSQHMHAPRDLLFSGWGLLHIVVVMLAGSFLAACLYSLSMRELEGETPTRAEVFAAGGQMFLPLLGLNILLYLGLALGLILLIVPGVMFGLAFCVAGPALIAEGVGVAQAFRRSADLTRGSRWILFALFLLFFVASACVDSVLGAIGLAVSWGSPGFFSVPRLLGSAILSTVGTALTLPGMAAIYVQLRELKGG